MVCFTLNLLETVILLGLLLIGERVTSSQLDELGYDTSSILTEAGLCTSEEYLRQAGVIVLWGGGGEEGFETEGNLTCVTRFTLLGDKDQVMPHDIHLRLHIRSLYLMTEDFGTMSLSFYDENTETIVGHFSAPYQLTSDSQDVVVLVSGPNLTVSFQVERDESGRRESGEQGSDSGEQRRESGEQGRESGEKGSDNGEQGSDNGEQGLSSMQWAQLGLVYTVYIPDCKPEDLLFQCDDKSCISPSLCCDEYNNCEDGSDEVDCQDQEEEEWWREEGATLGLSIGGGILLVSLIVGLTLYVIWRYHHSHVITNHHHHHHHHSDDNIDDVFTVSSWSPNLRRISGDGRESSSSSMMMVMVPVNQQLEDTRSHGMERVRIKKDLESFENPCYEGP